MKWFMPVVLVGVVATLGFERASQPMSSEMIHESSAATYEQLATAIIAIRNTETSLVRGIQMHSYALAVRECQAALDGSGRSRGAHLESAAREITNIASEGDKRIQAVRQRLLEAGHHHHHTEADSKDDYIFINAAEKKGLLDLAGRVAKLGSSASDDDIRSAMDELSSKFDAAMKE